MKTSRYLLLLPSLLLTMNAAAKPPIARAAQYGDRQKVLVYIALGADVDETESIGNYNAGWTALHLAAFDLFPEIVGDLIRAGANPEARINDGRTPFEVGFYHLVLTILDPSIVFTAASIRLHEELFKHLVQRNGVQAAYRLMAEEFKLFSADILEQLLTATMRRQGVNGHPIDFAIRMMDAELERIRVLLRGTRFDAIDVEHALQEAANHVLNRFRALHERAPLDMNFDGQARDIALDMLGLGAAASNVHE